MSYLRYLCLFMHSGVQHTLCCVFLRLRVPYVASFSGLSIFDCPFDILLRLLTRGYRTISFNKTEVSCMLQTNNTWLTLSFPKLFKNRFSP